MSRDPISRRTWTGLDRRAEIIALDLVPLVRQHAELESRRVVYTGPHEWFGKPERTAVNSSSRDNRSRDALVHCLVDAVRNAFHAGGEILDASLASYLANWLSDGIRAVEMHLGTRRLRPDRLPQQLWTGSGTRLWNRMLRLRTRAAGGRVIGHDHGQGAGFAMTASDTISDLEFCDAFVTYSAAQAEGVRKEIRREFLIVGTAPEIVALPVGGGVQRNAGAGPRSPEALAREMNASAAGQRVLYAMDLYTGEFVHGNPHVADVPKLDWQARLLAHIKRWGHDVFLKPHPETWVPMPPTLVDTFGAKVLDRPFEQVLDQADVVLFDWPFTTTFRSALMSDRPIVFVDFGLAGFSDLARKALAKRMEIVPGMIDATNRLSVSWDRLKEALEGARRLRDSSIVDLFFPS